MILKTLSILNYKNIEGTDLEFSPNINCLLGDNGEGKTNLLDAIYFLSFTHSMISNIDSQMIRHDADFFMLKGKYLDDSNNMEEIISVSMKRGSKKIFRRNDKAYKRIAEHIGLIPVITVSPDDIMLINGGSEERRKLLDIIISQYDNTYITHLLQYNKALKQRNALLKMDDTPDETLFLLWEEAMANHGEEVYKRRRDFIERFTPLFNDIYSMISEDKESVSLNYISHCQRGPLLNTITQDRYKDLAVGYSLHGIHRDDIEMSMGNFPMRREGSQGQNKTYVIALKLAQYVFLRQMVKTTPPLLLLDDIFDKLDKGRVEKIIEIVNGEGFGQIFITDTNREHLDKVLTSSKTDYKIFNVKRGEFYVQTATS